MGIKTFFRELSDETLICPGIQIGSRPVWPVPAKPAIFHAQPISPFPPTVPAGLLAVQANGIDGPKSTVSGPHRAGYFAHDEKGTAAFVAVPFIMPVRSFDTTYPSSIEHREMEAK